MDEAHKIRGTETTPMKVHDVSKRWSKTGVTAHSKYTAMTGSVADHNTLDTFQHYFKLFEGISEREGRSWSQDSNMSRFTSKELKSMAALYRKCQEEFIRAKLVTESNRRNSVRDYFRLVTTFVHRLDLDTKTWGYPIAVYDGITGVLVVNHTKRDEKMANDHYNKATDEVRDTVLARLRRKNRTNKVPEGELRAAVADEVSNKKIPTLAAWFPDILYIGSEYRRIMRQHYIANPNDKILNVALDGSASTMTWKSATEQTKSDWLKVEWTVESIDFKG